MRLQLSYGVRQQHRVERMSQRKKRLEGQIGAFIQQYKRKAYPTIDPNDRRYDREIEALVKRMNPEELDELMNGGDAEVEDE
jgi:hypothetical protein